MIETFRRVRSGDGGVEVKTIAHLLSRTELHLVLFVVALVAFLRPIVLPGPSGDVGGVMSAFFVPWALVIAALALIAIAARAE